LIHSNALLNGVHGTDGMVPGYYLENLTMIDHPDAELTFNAIGNLFALNTGEIAEGMWAGGQRGAAMLQYFPEGGDDVVARYRPMDRPRLRLHPVAARRAGFVSSPRQEGSTCLRALRDR